MPVIASFEGFHLTPRASHLTIFVEAANWVKEYL